MPRDLWDTIVIGGGASGLAAAITASEAGNRVALLEKNDRIGKKLAATGNGRCNLMNASAPRYYGDTAFAKQVLSFCGPREQRTFWHRLGVLLTEERDGLIYPRTLQAATVLEALKEAVQERKIRVFTQREATEIRPEEYGFSVMAGDLFSCRRVILSAGGSASPKLGGTDSGFRLLRQLGHPCTDLLPALVPLRTDAVSVSGLDGLRVRCSIRILREGQMTHQEQGEVLFTSTGLSGICAMQCGRFAKPGMTAELDLLYAEKDDMAKELCFRWKRFPERKASTIFDGILPARLSSAVFYQTGTGNSRMRIGNLTEENLRRLLYTAHHYHLTITGNTGMENAQVTAGGADCGFFRPDTLESRLIPGLHVTGELLNVDGDCGGFNLMFAFGSGILAGRNGGNLNPPTVAQEVK